MKYILVNNKKYKENPFPKFVQLEVKTNEDDTIEIVLMDVRSYCVLDVYKKWPRSYFTSKRNPQKCLDLEIGKYRLLLIKDCC